MHFHIISIFPRSFASYLEESILKKARKSGLIRVSFYNPRDFSKDKYKRVDEKPYGGGPGMVMSAEPVLRAVEKAQGRKKNVKIILLSPRGKVFTNQRARLISKTYRDIILIAGRYEGIDGRVKTILKPEEISIGPYILTGGELPALVVIDCVARQLEGVLGASESIEEDRIAPKKVYTRPPKLLYRGKAYKVPGVLLSGNHRKIEAFRRK